ncbi:RNA polymerase, alpha chain C terminal domain [Bradyrhizobium lablabi]|nr:RNA polymerase, alpha chain C terminal domain [Bradyrhizobium lablabi]
MRMLDTTRELADETLISDLELTTRIRNALAAAGVKTVGEVREMSDKALLSLPDFGQYSLSCLRGKLSQPSTRR